ncbi:MAG: hypothetical protein JNK78_15680 [Planctomycetes bacterium]|nr:hypothetical protein [Planctomycetota bacterium]
MNARTTNGVAGFSLIEVVIAAALLAMMIFAVSTLSVSGMEAQDYSKRLSRATELNQEILDRIRLELVSSVRTFGNDTEGNANIGVFDLTGAPTPLPGSRFATIATTGQVQQDTVSSQITGNALFFTKLAWSDRIQCHSGAMYMVDVYRWHLYYLTAAAGGPTSGSATGLDLVRVVSEPLIDATGIDRITDPTDLEEVLEHFHTSSPDANGVTHPQAIVVWRRGADPAISKTLRQIDDSDWSLSDSPLSGRPNPWRVLRDETDGLLEYRQHSVATNFARSALGVGRYSVVSTSGSGFPHGFEVQVVGPSSARQVLIHLVVAGTQRRGQLAWSDMRVVVDGREL